VGLAGARDGDGVSANSPRLLEQVVDHFIEVVGVTTLAADGLVRLVRAVRILMRVRVRVVVLVGRVVAGDVHGAALMALVAAAAAAIAADGDLEAAHGDRGGTQVAQVGDGFADARALRVEVVGEPLPEAGGIGGAEYVEDARGQAGVGRGGGGGGVRVSPHAPGVICGLGLLVEAGEDLHLRHVQLVKLALQHLADLQDLGVIIRHLVHGRRRGQGRQTQQHQQLHLHTSRWTSLHEN